MARIVFRKTRPPDERFTSRSAHQERSFWPRTLAAACLSGVAVAAVAAWRARLEGQSGWRPINSVSHILWGPKAAMQQRFTARYTVSGLVLNALACGFWAWTYGIVSRITPASMPQLSSAGKGIGVAALAYVTDYHIVPRRFTPGFEMSLSRRSFPWVYAALAAGLILPDWTAGEKGGVSDECTTHRELRVSVPAPGDSSRLESRGHPASGGSSPARRPEGSGAA